MSITTLTPGEISVVQMTFDGMCANFSGMTNSGGGPAVVIRAEVLRDLLLNLPLPPIGGPAGTTALHARSPRGVSIKFARIDGVLDLCDVAGSGEVGLPPLILEDCVLTGDPPYDDPAVRRRPAIDARHARLARVSLKNCRIGYVDFSDAQIHGDLDLDSLRGLTEEGQCWVNAREARIDGSVRAPCARLRLKQDARRSPEEALDYALMLAGAEISGGLYLRPEFQASGGVSIAGAQISGDLWADGAELAADQNYALAGQTACIDGVVCLRCIERAGGTERFRATGVVDLYGATIRGTLDMSGAMLKRSNPGDFAFSAPLAQIHGSVFLRPFTTQQRGTVPFETDGEIVLEGATLSGSFDLEFWASTLAESEHAIYAKSTRFKSDVCLIGNVGNVNLDGATIGRNLSIEAKLETLLARGLAVGGDIAWHGELRGKADFRGARVVGEVVLGENDDKKLKFAYTSRGRPELSFEDATITGDLKIGATLEVRTIVVPDWAKRFMRMRRRNLRFYPDWQLVEVLSTIDGRLAVGSFLSNPRKDRVVLLDGRSAPIHSLNAQRGLQLSDKDQAGEYLRFFCANVWGDDGAFKIVESLSDLQEWASLDSPAPGQSSPKVASEAESREESDEVFDAEKNLSDRLPDGSWEAEDVLIVYGNALYKARMRLHANGAVEMIDDKPLRERQSVQIAYIRPLRVVAATDSDAAGVSESELPHWPVKPAIGGPWEELNEEEVQALGPKLTAFVEAQQPEKEEKENRVRIDLRGASAGGLDDNQGTRWGERVHIDLNEFQYQRLDNRVKLPFDTVASASDARNGLIVWAKTSVPRLISKLRRSDPHFKARWSWLEKQYKTVPPDRSEYNPQPYEQLAKVLRARGEPELAARILRRRLRLERNVLHGEKFFRWWWEFLLDGCFGHGLALWPAFRSLLVCVLIGWAAVELANYGRIRWFPVGSHDGSSIPLINTKPVLVVETATVSTVALRDLDRSTPERIIAKDPLVLTTDSVSKSVKEISCGDQIESALYALDVFIPLLDLKQEEKCTVSSDDDAWLWRWVKSLYAITGWIVTSGLILCLMGFIRRRGIEK